MQRLRVRVHGLVQGVGYRWFVRQTAQRLGVAGWVRNHEDGSVEIVAAGGADVMDQFLRDVGRGPSGALVERVTRGPLDEGEALPSPFAIRR